MQELTITEAEAGQRFDKFLRKYLDQAAGSFVYKMLRKKNIVLNGSKASGNEMIHAGDKVKLFLADETIAKFHSAGGVKTAQVKADVQIPPMPELIYEDRDVCFINKPADMLVQSSNKKEPSVAEYLVPWLMKAGGISEEELRSTRPAPVNRLDRNTSGILLCGKSMRELQNLSRALHDRGMEKYYLAIVAAGQVKDGIYTAFAVKDEVKNRMMVRDTRMPGCVDMKTGVEVLAKGPRYMLVRIHLITGRTHQIRAHLAHLGCPVLGDLKYGRRSVNEEARKLHQVKRQMLHAYEIRFPDAFELTNVAGKVYRAELPADMKQVLEREGLMVPGKGRDR